MTRNFIFQYEQHLNGHNHCKLSNQKIKSSLYSLNTLSGVTSERCRFPWLCATAHISKLQRWRVVGNVWEIWSARDLNPIPPPHTSHTRSEHLCFYPYTLTIGSNTSYYYLLYLCHRDVQSSQVTMPVQRWP